MCDEYNVWNKITACITLAIEFMKPSIRSSGILKMWQMICTVWIAWYEIGVNSDPKMMPYDRLECWKTGLLNNAKLSPKFFGFHITDNPV
jgi:hypothetical protein